MSITTEKVVEMGEKKLLELMKEKSNNHIDPDKAKILIEKAEDTMRLSDYGLISFVFPGFHGFFEKKDHPK